MMLLWLLLSSISFAEVTDLVNSRHILLKDDNACEIDAVYAIENQDNKDDIVGFAEVVGKTKNTKICIARVINHSSNGLIRKKDRTIFLDLTKGTKEIHGRYDLVREGKKHYSSRYKPLVYAGYLYGQTAATLDKGEFLVGIFPVAYGLTDSLQLDLTPLVLISKAIQGGAKFRFLKTEDFRLSIYGSFIRFLELHNGSWSVDLLVDSTSNSTSMAHTRFRFESKLPDDVFLQNKSRKRKYIYELSTNYEWILNSWHRILLGPKYSSGENSEFGFNFSTLLIYDRFHLSLNLVVNSLKKFSIKEDKQQVGLDLFWRF
ncbi:MAG: hypothetical protein M9962_13165 [Oligoflexia bacterium]|nr:hypothetical protein [Oligoflexia bacterium]